ncbi:hypothetical protein [Nodosilinea sp. P-1105]|nr:hypothetical protein [Nodosilinea sp. P-1105]
MDRQISGTRRRQVIKELRHQLRYASLEERDGIRQQLNFWEQQR